VVEFRPERLYWHAKNTHPSKEEKKNRKGIAGRKERKQVAKGAERKKKNCDQEKKRWSSR